MNISRVCIIVSQYVYVHKNSEFYLEVYIARVCITFNCSVQVNLTRQQSCQLDSIQDEGYLYMYIKEI